MPGALTDLAVAGKLLARSLGRRLRWDVEAPPDLDLFQQQMQAVLDTAPEGVIRHAAWLTMPASQPPWLGTDIELSAGEEVSYFLAGRTYANRLLDIYVSPQLQVWCQVGEGGNVFRGTRASHSFKAVQSGELRFGNYSPNDWAKPSGERLQDDEVYKEVSGEVRILAICWAGSAEAGLRTLLNADHQGRVRGELERLAAAPAPPEGWSYLWHLGPAEIYQSERIDQGSCIHCRTHGDVGILQKDVDLPLREDSEISWRWCVEQLPTTLREDSVPSHDYLSIAVEFDNGRDITYYWSSNLAEGFGYDCPLPNWQGKEYHVVVRSGTAGLGEWLPERRNLMADYRHYMGEPPARIVKVWLIANSIFQRGQGRCDYADIVLHGDGRETRVL